MSVIIKTKIKLLLHLMIYLIKNNVMTYSRNKYKAEKVFRVRVGDYRILYSVSYEENLILIIKVDKRGRVY